MMSNYRQGLSEFKKFLLNIDVISITSKQKVRDKIWLGTWVLGGEHFGFCDEKESIRVINTALDAGIIHIDTANFYAHSNSEKILAKVLKYRKRDKIYISSKAGLLWDGKRVIHDSSPENIKKTLYQSLKTLKTNYIDLFSLHWIDSKTPIIDSLEVLEDLKSKHFIKEWGICNFNKAQIEKYIKINQNIHHQVHFNPIVYNYEVLKAGKSQHRCINIITSPTEQGLLSSPKYLHGKKLSNKDIRNRNHNFFKQEIHNLLKEIFQLSIKLPYSMSQLLLLWYFQNSFIDAICIGPRNTQQLEDYLQLI